MEISHDRLLEYCRERRLRRGQTPILAALSGIALARADFERSQQKASEAYIEQGGSFHYVLRAARAELTGDVHGALSQRRANPGTPLFPQATPQTTGRATDARILFDLGDFDGAMRELAAWAERYAAGHLSASIEIRISQIVLLDDALMALGADELVREVHAEASGWDAVRFAPRPSLGVDRFRGALALRLGLTEEAERHFRTGLAWAEREGAVIEEGRNLQGLAEIAERRGDHPEAARLLDRAAAIFQRHGIQLYLRQVLAKKEILKA